MPIAGKFYKYPGDNPYNEGVVLNEYNGSYGISFANEGNNGTVYIKWGYPQRIGSREPIEKSLPWEVKLGSQGEAIKILRNILADLEGSNDNPEGETPF